MLIGTYEIERKLGEGGMGTVWLARSRGGRAVAVKVARPELAADPGFRERFRAEIAAARRVGGFHTAQVVDADPDAEAPWLATAYVPGPTLAGLVAAEGPMDERRLRALGAALAEALEAIHACGLVHRDLKPGNIVMAADGPRVLDFGIARALESTRLTATGTAFGTPGYLAPEQALGEEVTGAADVFALGGVLVAAAGGRAFGDGTPMGLMYRTVHEAPDLSSVPAALAGLVGACLAKSPSDRPSPGRILDELVRGETVVDAVLPAHTPPTDVSPVDATPRDATPEGVPPVDVPPRDATPADVPPMDVPPIDRQPTYVPPPHAPAPHVPPPLAPAPRAPAPHVPPVVVADARGPSPVHDAVPVPALPTMPVAPPEPAPALIVADSACGLVADADGVHFELHGEEAEFDWSEIGSVEYESVHWGRRLRVVVTLRDGDAYICEVGGKAAHVQGWMEQMDRVLDRYLSA